MKATPSKSYSGSPGVISLKNPSLVRQGNISSQRTMASVGIYRYDCSIPSYVSSAQSIYDSSSIIVQVLWGLGKYPLFIGFGWMFMPLMLALQYIMSLNYLNTKMPLNLNYFLSSFQDFRNPSIFYNPMRIDMDASVINHK